MQLVESSHLLDWPCCNEIAGMMDAAALRHGHDVECMPSISCIAFSAS